MENSYGVKLEITDHILHTSPHCEHGPTVIFERQSKIGSCKRYYACSTIRDRKICSFYKLCSETFGESFKPTINATISKYTYIGDWFFKLNSHEMYFCRDCEFLFYKPEKDSKLVKNKQPKKRKLELVSFNNEIVRLHETHHVISCDALIEPSLLLNPLTNDKSNAQYLFSDESCKTICDMITFKYNYILFLATPRLFEYYRKHYLPKMAKKILLMDIDERFIQFYSKKLFCRFNMFNFYFYNDDEAKIAYKLFLSSAYDNDKSGKKILILLDPPFNAMVQQIMYSINRITRDFFLNQLNDSNKIKSLDIFSDSMYLPTIMTFPKFMCPRIKSFCEEAEILNIPVTYNNHPKFSNNRSPIRIYKINTGS